MLRARDRRTGRIVAIKEVLRPQPGLIARFAREAIVTANLQHPAIIPVYEVGRWNDGDAAEPLPFYAMKLVAGASLADVARKAKTLGDRIALVPHIISVAEALAYAHGERVIHRDLKPANVLIGDFGETVVIDWGLAKRLDDMTADELASEDSTPTEGKTIFGAILGTPGYMPPEQARGDLVDERSDVYAIGAMLYEVLSGVRPFAESDGGTEVLKRTIAEPPRPLAQIAPEVPPELVAIVERAMASDPARRYRTAKPLAEDLVRYTTGKLVEAQRYTAWMLIRRWIAKHRAVVAVASAAVVVLALVATIGLLRIRTERDRAITASRIAEDRAAALAEEQGRQLTVSGDAPRGLPFLADAIARGRSSVPLRFVLQRALDRIAGVEAVLVGSPTPIDYVSYSKDGARLVASGTDVRVWDVRTRRLLQNLGTGYLGTFSPDGRWIVMVEDSGQVQLRDATTLAIVRKLPPLLDTDAPLAIAFAPNGQMLAVGGAHGHAALYALDGSAQKIWQPHTGAIVAIGFSHDGALLGTASQDQSAAITSVATATEVTRVKHGEAVRDIQFAPGDQRFVTCSVDGTAVEWDAAGKQLHVVKHDNAVQSARYAKDGAQLVTASSDHTVAIWELATQTKLAGLDTKSPVIEAKYDPSGATIAARTERGDIFVWNSRGGDETILSGHISSVADFQWSPDGAQMASGGLDGDVRLWRPNLHAVTELATTTAAWRSAWSPDGTKIAVSSKDGAVVIYDGTTGAVTLKLAGHAQEVTWLAFSPDGTTLATASADATVKLWNLATGDDVTLAANAGRVRSVVYSHDGATIATAHDDGSLHLWDAKTYANQRTLPAIADHNLRRAVWSPDDREFVVPLDGGGAMLYQRDGTLIAPLVVPGNVAITAAWRPDGQEFTVAGGTVEVARFTRDGKALGELVGTRVGPLLGIDYAATGELASIGGDGVARIWRGDTQVQTIGDAAFRMSAVSYRGDAALIATGALDTNIYDTRTGLLVGVLPGHVDIANSSVSELHWSPDGTRLLVNSISLPPRLWRVPEWHGTSEELAARLRCALREKLEDARLVPAAPDPASCRPLGR